MTSSTTWTTRPNLSDVERFWTAPVAERAAAFAALREREPVPFFEEPQFAFLPQGAGYWALTRLDDLVEASRNAKVFTSGPGATSIADMPPEFLEFYGSMINTDDPRHARLRRIVSRGFTPRRLAALTDEVQATATAIVDDVVDAGEVDAVTAISARLPLKIVCDMMGVPESQYDFVFQKSNVILGASDPEYVPDAENIIVALLEAGNALAELMRDLGRHREANPTDDVTSALVNAEIDGERLTNDELASFFILLVVAGNETTRNAISWGLKLLTDHPEQRRIWLDDLDGVTPTAVEEIVRWASPVIYMRRTLAVDAVLGGQEMSAGDKLLLFYWAANRDPAHFTDPDAFDVRRSPNPHVGFGGAGPHFCLGAHLARREMAVMFRELLTRVPDIHATAEPRRLQSMFINGIKSMPVSIR
ncbi:cytochrome P450 [Pseudonocardia sp. KRD-184]|uniref:Cytochrome P450 n=1 Tax=Pseudonocardia oceani TaxID=2792013 RepID=A0ABS6U7Q8_9PSEU|nr:cytochrome P450 [Pseudonocardia oceani]MBW0091849.1 cytochrome P450 [Pseudonocardia oceani]MBW0098971.1 cytochrome P450 [Pseudonocardia oceani]MBW0111460.1 cytochrome P450 [Pseudonocardia oceani]MBW0125207.1 cytochrome P450 [Pseudonocardia oceani]MBW0128038.1 cytochrome P450 [Pseudonocardia oceani]